MSDPDVAFMKAALVEAKKGIGRTSPNPAVGSVVVKGGKLIAKGYHKKAGTPHAEIHALRSAGNLADGATLYVTLEPCNHIGLTPPCTHAILRSGIKRVVVGMIDPNPLVAGTGCRYLQENGIDVRHGVLDNECRGINYPFIKHITTGLPWVIMKAGCSLDGRIAASNGQSGWITNDKSRAEVHRIRDRVDAILVGSGTVAADDPSLTTRLRGRKGKDPLRVVLDSSLQMSPAAKMLNQSSDAQTWIFCSVDAERKKAAQLEKAGARILTVPHDVKRGLHLDAILQRLGSEKINSILVEGGSRVHGSFLREGLVDQFSMFLAPVFLGGDAVPVVDNLYLKSVQDGRRFITKRTRRFGDDVYIEGLFQ